MEEEPTPWWIVWLRRVAVLAFFLLLLAPLFLLISSFRPTTTGWGGRGGRTGLPDDILPTLNSIQRNLLTAGGLALVLAVVAMLRRSTAG